MNENYKLGVDSKYNNMFKNFNNYFGETTKKMLGKIYLHVFAVILNCVRILICFIISR